MARVLLYRGCPTASNGYKGKEVFWDTDLRQQIVLSLTSAPSCSPYFIAPNTLLDTFCEGTTKKEVFSVWDGTGRPPRIDFTRTVETLNSSSCGIQNVCGLTVTDVQITETDLGEYSATVLTTGGGTKFFTLTQGGIAGTDNVFENLSAGTYTVYVTSFYINSDGRGKCSAQYTFTIKNPERARFYTHFADNKERIHRVEWLLEGWTGEAEYLKASGDNEPLDIEYQGTGNKIDVLHGSGAAMRIIVQRDELLQEFYTTEERHFRVNHTIDGVLNWTGWHIPDIYSEPWIALPYEAVIEAHDAIGALEGMPYLNEQGIRYYGRARAIEIIFRILRKLELNLPVYIAVNVWEDTMDLNVEPLSQAYYDQELYYDEDNIPLSCKEVLERVLNGYNAILRQAEGALHIIRYKEVNDAYTRRKADLGTGDSSIQFNLESEEYLNEYWIEYKGETSYRLETQRLNIKPALKQVTTITEYGEYENFVLNGDFERWEANRPLLWEGTAEVERILDGEKFLLGFKNPNTEGIISQNTYLTNVQSSIGFTFKFDYTIAIEDFVEKPGLEWLVQPEFTLTKEPSGGIIAVIFSLTNSNLTGGHARAVFNGTEKVFPPGEVTSRTGAWVSVPGVDRKRIDLVYANPDGTITYQKGEDVGITDIDKIITEPENSLLITYITWQGGEPHFSSTSSDLSVKFPFGFKIGDYQAFIRPTTSRRATIDNTMDPERRNGLSTWIHNPNGGPYYGQGPTDIVYVHKEVTSKDGYIYISGTCILHTKPMNTPGLPSVAFGTPEIGRDNLERVQITIDNVVFQERQMSNIDKMLITGENEGKINTPPFGFTLYHGSALPRVQALITLEDGSATQFWNNGQKLQQLVAQDILDQHARPALVLVAEIAGKVTPLSVLRDPNLPDFRFFIDRFIYHARSGMTSIEALQVFGGKATDGGDTGFVLLKEDGTALLQESGDYIKL